MTVGTAPQNTAPIVVGSRPEARLRKLLGWLIGIRLIVITSIILPFLLAPEQVIYDYLLQGTGAVYAASLAYLVMHVGGRPSLILQAYIQFAGDLLFITGLVYYSGGYTSSISILYLIVITLASVYSRRRAGVIVASAAWVLYATVVVALYFGWIETPGDPQSGSLSRLVYNLGVHFLGFYAIAFLTSHLARSVERAEQALEIKREDLADLQVAHHDVLESLPSGIITTDPNGRIASANAAAHAILGKDRLELIGFTLADIEFLTAEEWSHATAVDNVQGIPRLDVEYTVDGFTRHVGYSVNPLKRADGSTAGRILIFQDLSEWRRLQEELRIKDRMAAVGTMASGLAHEIGNPLAAISGSVQMLSAEMPQQSSQSKLLQIILKESERLDRTIKGFLKFARPQQGKRLRFDVGSLLAENVELLRNSREVRAEHQIELDLDPPTMSLVGDPDQISQIFWNLARNALRAMDSAGLLKIVGRVEEPFYRMRFTDTGRGMKEEERANLFQPFRSFFDEGSGIGMAIVYRIVEEHEGRVHVESSPGKGTTITIELPLVGSVATPISAARAAK
jgi:two-component system sensor histidine kinase PilS (NtrC family)